MRCVGHCIYNITADEYLHQIAVEHRSNHWPGQLGRTRRKGIYREMILDCQIDEVILNLLQSCLAEEIVQNALYPTRAITVPEVRRGRFVRA